LKVKRERSPKTSVRVTFPQNRRNQKMVAHLEMQMIHYLPAAAVLVTGAHLHYPRLHIRPHSSAKLAAGIS
jgi:hypothetical protein